MADPGMDGRAADGQAGIMTLGAEDRGPTGTTGLGPAMTSAGNYRASASRTCFSLPTTCWVSARPRIPALADHRQSRPSGLSRLPLARPLAS